MCEAARRKRSRAEGAARDEADGLETFENSVGVRLLTATERTSVGNRLRTPLGRRAKVGCGQRGPRATMRWTTSCHSSWC